MEIILGLLVFSYVLTEFFKILIVSFIFYWLAKYFTKKENLPKHQARTVTIFATLLPIIGAIIYYSYELKRPYDAKYSPEQKAEIAKRAEDDKKTQQYWKDELGKYQANLKVACETEQKMTVNKKIPAKSIIFMSNDGDKIIIEPKNQTGGYYLMKNEVGFSTANLITQCAIELQNRNDLSNSLKENATAICNIKYQQPANWVTGINFPFNDLVKLAKADYIETVEASKPVKYLGTMPYDIPTITAPYQLIATDISTPEDRNKGIRRGLMQLTDRKTKKVMSEYVSFDMLPYYDKSNPRFSWHNCLNLNEDIAKSNPHVSYDINTNYRYFFENAVE